MSGTPKDIDPASELREEDEEATLPELEPIEAPAGTLAAGSKAIARAVKHAPSAPLPALLPVSMPKVAAGGAWREF